jgi:hypothetical protein
MPMIRADIVHYKGDREHIGIRRRIADTFPKLDVVLRQHMKGLRANTSHDWEIKPSDDNESVGFLGPYYYEIRSKTTDHWFWVIAQCGVF